MTEVKLIYFGLVMFDKGVAVEVILIVKLSYFPKNQSVYFSNEYTWAIYCLELLLTFSFFSTIKLNLIEKFNYLEIIYLVL